ncbi:PEP/pyruvate-binding domain-containing protein [Nonomuraea soli]|uniref:Pyruvate,water dikinase n=1 Tax=Nonomuraea soli TaxID=1032476 RepID=A0A7W0CNN8_9ACTN|nr:PEP/pyruvate-binding domain-containing protein [Nonomuraea soli]MBA2894496.1 pyruvate,water dikinase [Nonomuraea soli]
MTLAYSFHEIDASMLAEVGGKAANLGQLTRAGLPVPPGGCLSTEAYGLVAAGLDELIARAPAGELAARARELLLAAPVPESVRKAVAGIYPGGAVAVRSSATAEDLPHASFAGQQDTYLNVVGEDAVVEAVRRCWASLWTDRAVAYREANGIDHGAVRLAVVIQRMVDSAVAGVMFTANPVTGRRHEAVIDASPGLGEAVVSGAVNPDRFVVHEGEILERHAGDKRMAIRSLPGGGTEREELDHDGFCLTDAQVLELAALGRRVEDHYGAPQDTEWAIDDGGTLWLTQARPITTLYPLPAHRAEGLRAYFSFNVAQGVFGPLTPLGLSGLKLVSSGMSAMFGFRVADRFAGASPITDSGGRLWIDITPALRSRVGRAVLPRMLSVGEARAGVIFERLTERPEFSVTQHSRRPFLRRIGRFARRMHVPSRVRLALTNPERAIALSKRIGAELDARLGIAATATPLERLDHAERVLHAIPPVIASIMPMALTGYGMLGLASRLSGMTLSQLQDVLRSVPNNPTTEMDLELWHLATRIEPFPDVPVAELVAAYHAGTLPQREQIAAFLDTYGHRGVAEIDLGVPRWSDDPTHIIGVLANYLRMDTTGPTPDVLFARGAAEAQALIDRAAARAGRVKGRVVRFALGRARTLVGLREVPKYYIVVTLTAVRRSMAVVGEHLASLGLLETADDVYFLTLPEIRSAVNGAEPDLWRALVAERRASYAQERRRRHVPRMLLSDGTEPEALAVAAAEGDLVGTPASAGTVTGPARVVLDPLGAHLEPGEILVCPSTDPGWTPLFLTAGGLVMEMGGAMSHGAVVAREYGIPAVVGVPDATHRIATGEVITVDGATGTVTLPRGADDRAAAGTVALP